MKIEIRNDVGIFLKIFRSDYMLGLLNKIYSIFIGIVSSAFYVRYLGIEYKGTYSYINEIATIIALVINFGIYQSYPFYFRKKGHNIFEKYLNLFIFQFLFYLAVSIAVIRLFNDNIILVYIFLQLPFLVLKTQLDNVILVEKIRLFLWVDIGLKSVLAIIYFLLWRFAPVKIGFLILSVSITNFIVCIIYICATGYKISLKKLVPDKVFVEAVIKFGFFPMLSSLLITLNYSVDILFLRNMGEAIELSLYSVAAVIINYVWVIPNAFKEVLISRVAREDSANQVASSIKISLLLTFGCLLGFIIFGKIAIKIVFGVEFLNCYYVTLILFIGAFSMILFKMLGVVFVAEGRQKQYFIILFVSVCINLIANYFFIPVYGMYGAAMASVISYTICGFTFLKEYCRWKNQKISKFLWIGMKEICSLFGIVNIKNNERYEE